MWCTRNFATHLRLENDLIWLLPCWLPVIVDNIACWDCEKLYLWNWIALSICRCQRSSQCPMCWQSISLKDPTRFIFMLAYDASAVHPFFFFFFFNIIEFAYLSMFWQSRAVGGCWTREEYKGYSSEKYCCVSSSSSWEFWVATCWFLF